MERHRSIMPSELRYPLFFIGLLVMIVGGVIALRANAPLNVDVVLASVGFILLAVSVAIR